MDDIQPPSGIKILIVRLSSIGDIVLTTPVVRAVKQQVHGIELHFLVKKQMAQVISTNPYVDKLHQYDKDTVGTLIAELKAEKFDFVVDLQNNRRSRRVIRKLHVPSSTFQKLDVKKFISVFFKLNLLPSGIFHKNAVNLLGTGVVLSLSYVFDILLVYGYVSVRYHYRPTLQVLQYTAIQLPLGIAVYIVTLIESPLIYWSLGLLLCFVSGVVSLQILHQKTGLWNALKAKVVSKFGRHG